MKLTNENLNKYINLYLNDVDDYGEETEFLLAESVLSPIKGLLVEANGDGNFILETQLKESSTYEKEIIEEQITDSGEKQKSTAEVLTDLLVPKPIERGMEEERMDREELIQREKNKKIKEAEAAQLLDGLIDDDFSGMGDGLTDEERVKKSKALYKKLLSGDRSPLTQDLSDWALSLFEKSTKEGATVKSMLGEVAGEISKKPSRTETLDRDASKIAIQDFMMSKKAKADAEAFKGKTDYQYKLKS